MFKPRPLDASLKKAYEDSLAKDKIQLTQVSTLAGIAVFIFSIFIDSWALPSVQQEVLILRMIVVIALILSFATTLSKDFFIKHYTNILIATFTVISLPVEVAIHMVQASELAYYLFFSVLIVIIMVLFSWTYLSTAKLALTTAMILGGYILAVLTRDEQGPHGAMPLLIVSLTILSGAIFIGYIGRLIRDKHMREKFRLQQSFKALFEEKAKEAETHKHLASHDTLTGLPNRRFVENDLINHLMDNEKHNLLMVVMFLDLNGFKKINDDYGHDAGDLVLKSVASRLNYCLTNIEDSLIRLGGDEFLICITIAKDNNERDIINIFKKRVKDTIEQAIIFEGQKLHVSTSIGIARSDHDGNDINQLIAVADKRMYQDKGYSREAKALAKSNVTELTVNTNSN